MALSVAPVTNATLTSPTRPATFAEELARTNPSGAGFNASNTSGLAIQSQPSSPGLTNTNGGSAVFPGTPNFGATAASTPAAVTPSAADVAASAAASAQAAKQAQLETDYQTNKNNTMNTITDSVNQASDPHGAYNSSILDYLDSRRAQQTKVDSDATNAELTHMDGTNGVLTMVGHGLQSTGVRLANAGASNSSAGEAFARAYGELGRTQQATVNSKYAQDQNTIGAEQAAIGAADNTQTRHTAENKTATINAIVNQATTQLAALNQAAAYASLPERIDIDQKKQEIHDQAMAALSQYDQVLAQGIAKQAPIGTPGAQARAATLQAAGTAPESDFNFSTVAPTTLASPGVSASTLPIYTGKRLATA